MSEAPLSKNAKHKARAYALQLRYASDVAAEVTTGHAASHGDEAPAWAEQFEVSLSPEALAFAQALHGACLAEHERIDGLISTHSRNWRLERMARIDRNVLRLGVAELIAFPSTAPSVVINEAIELGKRFGTAESGAFINGILDRVAKALA